MDKQFDSDDSAITKKSPAPSSTKKLVKKVSHSFRRLSGSSSSSASHAEASDSSARSSPSLSVSPEVMANASKGIFEVSAEALRRSGTIGKVEASTAATTATLLSKTMQDHHMAVMGNLDKVTALLYDYTKISNQQLTKMSQVLDELKQQQQERDRQNKGCCCVQ